VLGMILFFKSVEVVDQMWRSCLYLVSSAFNCTLILSIELSDLCRRGCLLMKLFLVGVSNCLFIRGARLESDHNVIGKFPVIVKIIKGVCLVTCLFL
jgi:hypothetical protein